MEGRVSENMASMVKSGSGGGSVDPEIVEIFINHIISTASKKLIRELHKLKSEMKFHSPVAKGVEGKILNSNGAKNSSKETKLPGIDIFVLKGSGVPMHWDFCSLDAAGASGGILLAWDGNKFEMVEFWVGVFSVSIVLSDIQKKDRLTFSGVYGPVLRGEKKLFWEELDNVRSRWDFPWCVGGDFNEIRWEFTWWLDLFPGARQIAIEHSVSDHCPVILDPQMESWGPSPFRFEIAWLKFPMMTEKLGGWWGECYASGSSDVVIGTKLRYVEKKLKEWKVENIKTSEARLVWLRAKIRELKLKVNANSATVDEMLEVNKCCIIPEGVNFNSLLVEDANNLERPFSEEEVEKGLSSMVGDKAPGSDGFCMAFFQSCWDYVKGDVMRFFREFFDGLELDCGTCSTFIALIPKVKGASSIGEFRPISFVGCLYKLLAKILASRLKLVMPLIFSDYQLAFVSKRQILDCSLIANETIDYYAKCGRSGVVCKLDMEKAYDRVEWHYLDYVMGRMGFEGKWRAWMAKCISSPWFSILINGSPFGYFKSSRGLRQGDPLSPFLFVMVAETLNRLIAKGSVAKLMQGFYVGQREVEVSHLQFVDDTLLFCSPEVESVLYLKAIIRWYELISGQCVNFHKSKLYCVNMDHELSLGLASIMGCKLDHFPSSYLRLPLGFGRPNIASWVPIVERVERRLILGRETSSLGVVDLL
ncbi:uncharacterized protein LOC143886076 [Tasmannia lanceolata]|uniref:uncharacterized protein LOC143886076 n=1 Tax=Tasmannia lanceolata TaxID=3420 RepID=UPI004062F38A